MLSIKYDDVFMGSKRVGYFGGTDQLYSISDDALWFIDERGYIRSSEAGFVGKLAKTGVDFGDYGHASREQIEILVSGSALFSKKVLVFAAFAGVVHG